MSNQMKSFLISANALILGAVLGLVFVHLYQDHVLVDAIRSNINSQQQRKIIPNAEIKSEPKAEEVPKK